MPVISTKFKIDGEKEYKQAISGINSEMKVLKSEMKLVSERYAENAESSEALAAKGEVLEKQLESQRQKVNTYKKALEEARSATDVNQKAVNDWQVSLNNAERELIALERQLDENNDALDKATKETREYDEAQEDAIEGGATLGDALDGLASKFGVEIPGGISSVLGPLGEVNAGFLGLAGIAGTAAAKIIDVAKETMNYVDELNTRSAISGIATDTLQEFEYIADLVDVSVERLTDSTKDLTTRIGDAIDGNEEYMASFNRLGVSLMDSSGKVRDMEAIFWDVIYALSEMEAGVERDNLAMQLMGEGARELNPMLNQTREGLIELRDSAEEAGYVMDEKTLKNVQRLKDGLDELTQKIQGSVRRGFGELANWLAGDFSASDMRTGLAYESGYIGRNANGTSYWRGGLTWVGENGPELVSLPTGSAVYSAKESQAISSPIINIYGAAGQDVNEIANAVANVLYNDVARKGAAYK